MHVQVLTLKYSADLDQLDGRPLDAFLQGKALKAFRAHFYRWRGEPRLVAVLTYDGDANAAVPAPVQGEPDAEPWNRQQQALLELLRAWRSKAAREHKVPPFRVLTNRQLANIVRAQPKSESELARIELIGGGTLERFGREILAQVQESLKTPH